MKITIKSNNTTSEVEVNENDTVACCESCGEFFNTVNEPKEVAEGGIYMCEQCWNQE